MVRFLLQATGLVGYCVAGGQCRCRVQGGVLACQEQGWASSPTCLICLHSKLFPHTRSIMMQRLSPLALVAAALAVASLLGSDTAAAAQTDAMPDTRKAAAGPLLGRHTCMFLAHEARTHGCFYP